jgi:hypothetical protein
MKRFSKVKAGHDREIAAERRDWIALSATQLARCYADDEPEYAVDMIVVGGVSNPASGTGKVLPQNQENKGTTT